eukprot:gene10387-19084_t
MEKSNASISRSSKPYKAQWRKERYGNKTQELNRFLFQYRNTPHSTMAMAPSELLFNRKVQGKLPTLENHRIINRHKEARIKGRRSRSKFGWSGNSRLGEDSSTGI